MLGVSYIIYSGTLDYAQITHDLNQVFPISYDLFEGLVFACHHNVLLLLYYESQRAKELHMRSTTYYCFVLSSFLEFNYTTLVVRRSRILVCTPKDSLDVSDSSYAHSNFTTTYVTTYYLSLTYCVTFTLAIPTCLSVSS